MAVEGQDYIVDEHHPNRKSIAFAQMPLVYRENGYAVIIARQRRHQDNGIAQ